MRGGGGGGRLADGYGHSAKRDAENPFMDLGGSRWILVDLGGSWGVRRSRAGKELIEPDSPFSYLVPQAMNLHMSTATLPPSAPLPWISQSRINPGMALWQTSVLLKSGGRGGRLQQRSILVQGGGGCTHSARVCRVVS